MIRQSCNTALRFLIGMVLILTLFVFSGGKAAAESATDYASPFNILSQFVPGIPDGDGAVPPGTLKPDADGNYLLRFQMAGGGLGNIRVFIPTGAIKVNINLYAGVDAHVGMVARYNSPPQCDYTQVSYPYWFCFPWDRDGGTLTGMTGTDMRFRNCGGHAFVVSQYFVSPLGQGGWLYLKVLDPDPSYSIHLFEYAVIVKGDAYRAWHALGSVPAAIGTVSGGCTFAAAPDCSPTSSTPTTPPSNTNSGIPTNFFGLNINNSGGTSFADLIASFTGGTDLSPTHGGGEVPGSDMETRLDVEIDTTVNGVGGEKVYRDADLTNYSMITLNASLKFEGLPSDDVDCFAIIVAQGTPFFIHREVLFETRGPSWLLFSNGDRIYRYGSENVAEKSSWVCNAFNFLNGLKLPPGLFTEYQLQFIYAIAPVGEVDMGKYENVRYGIISFFRDADSELEAESPALEESPAEATPPVEEPPAE